VRLVTVTSLCIVTNGNKEATELLTYNSEPSTISYTHEYMYGILRCTDNKRKHTELPTRMQIPPTPPLRPRALEWCRMHSRATTKAGSGKSDSFYEVAITASLTSPEHLCYRYETLGY